MKKILGMLSIISITAPMVTTVVSCLDNPSKGNSEGDIDFNVGDLNPDAEIVDNPEAENLQNQFKNNQVKNTSANDVLYGVTNGESSTKSNNINSRMIITQNQEAVNPIATQDLLQVSDETTFTPYADTGIVEDTAEYALKWFSKSGNSRSEAERILEEHGMNNAQYNTGDYLNHLEENNKEYQGVKLGFMQNASDSGELIPMWNAAPAKVNDAQHFDENNPGILSQTGEGTEYADWFNQRIDSWLPTDENLREDVTISFGPFANSFWHTAWLNNKTAWELADAIEKIGERYGTKKFEFYFASPYLTSRGDYYDSQKLLAAALNILLQRDPSYDFTLALVVSTKDGVAVNNDGFNMILGDEASPLYVFTQYLGTNFRLNLVPYLTVSDSSSVETIEKDSDWELPTIEAAIDATAKTWKNLHKLINNQDIADMDTFYNRMGVTPWIGRRAEKAVYHFTPQDAFELRKWAESKNLGNLSMFYLSRDVPSLYQESGSTNDNYSDKSPLDQNIRSGAGWSKYAYTDALSGIATTPSVEDEAKTESEIKSRGGITAKDFEEKSFIDDMNALEQQTEWIPQPGETPNPGIPEGGNEGNAGIDPPTPPSGQGTSLYTSWADANPNRTSNITKQSEKNSSVYYSPYVDAGLYQGNDIETIKRESGLDHLTLAFVQQANYQNDHMELSIAGIPTNDDNYKWWSENQLWGQMLKPMAESGNFENIKTAYGGATTGGYYEKNPWDWALNYNPNNPGKDIDVASKTLEEGLIGYQQSLVDLANEYSEVQVSMPKSIDFDIEGEAQNRDEANHVLGKTLARMKKNDPSWDFSITLPVLPSGLTSTGYKVMNIIVEEYKNAGLSYTDLPVINLMLMDYGDPIYQEAIRNGLTNFDLAQSAIENTRNNYAKSVKANYNLEADGDILFSKIGATPMIGVNDTIWGVFTLEDAKELYNYANTVGLAYLSMWSMNDDRGVDIYSRKPINKSLLTHGLGYLNEYDFAKALNGTWDEGVKNPKRNV